MQIKIKVDTDSEKILFTQKVNSENLNIIYDTGADYPTWCGSEKLLKLVFNLTEKDKSNNKINISGIGGKEENCNVWIIPEFILYDMDCIDKTIKICNMPIIVANDIDGIDMLLSNNIFSLCNIIIKNTPAPKELIINSIKDPAIFAIRELVGSKFNVFDTDVEK